VKKKMLRDMRIFLISIYCYTHLSRMANKVICQLAIATSDIARVDDIS
jgi:hypothetical protein